MTAVSSLATAGTSSALVTLQNAAAAKADPSKGVDAASKEFEGVFISEMLSHMFEGSKTDPVFGGGKGEDMFKSMMISEYGKKIADGGGIGLSSEIKSMMIEMQQKANGG